ncbi:MAG: beta-lactamase family protein [Gemmatimonadota bacterium]|nr:beta-lactamase family protein [Gemmatimonadota bacterium]
MTPHRPTTRITQLALALAAILAAAPLAAQSAPARAAPVDTALLAQATARAAELPRLRSLLIAYDGGIVTERYFRGARADRGVNIKSVSKSIIAALVGIAIREGHLKSVRQPVAELLPSHFGPATDARKRAITVEDLLTMRAGLESTSFGNYGAWVTSRDWVRAAIAQPLVAEPGGEMIYSTGSSHLLSAILTRATGVSTHRYAARVIGVPLGITIPPWQRDPQGVYFGGNDMYLTPRAMLRFGMLYLERGRARGRQVVSAEWVDSSFVPRARSGWSGHDYGYGWWARSVAGHEVRFAWGYGGQFIFVVPDLRLVVVATSLSTGTNRDGGHLDAIHELVDRYVIPAVRPGA